MENENEQKMTPNQPIESQEEMPTPQGLQLRKMLIIGGGLLGVLALFTIVGVFANDDCITTVVPETRVAEINGICTDGAWGDWTTTTNEDGIQVSRRVYTGTRDLRTVFNYSIYRETCFDERSVPYTRSERYSAITAVSESVACQMVETRTPDCPGCTGDPDDPDDPTGNEVVTVITVDTPGTVTQETTTVNSLEEMDRLRAELIDSRITVTPSMVRPGAPTLVEWNSVEMTGCKVTADLNADVWSTLTGEQESSPILEETTYTLDCTAFNGTKSSESATVRVAPTWEEF